MQQTLALQSALTKLAEVLEEENAVLEQYMIIPHAGFTDRKNHALRELMAVQRRDASAAGSAEMLPLLQRLSSVLRVNSRLLKDHIAAVGEVSDILVAGLRQGESDGTYSRYSDRRGAS